jgi:hypothetical protein
MTEERKHAILLAATILCARKLMEMEDGPSPARLCVVDRAISEAASVGAGQETTSRSIEKCESPSKSRTEIPFPNRTGRTECCDVHFNRSVGWR